MRLGTDTGSMTNHIYSLAVKGQPEPKIGMGATVLSWTDRDAATVIAIEETAKGLVVTVREDIARRVDQNGLSESQEYEYTPSPRGHVNHFRREADGRWQAVVRSEKRAGWKMVKGGLGLRMGERRSYRDFSF